ncbi:MAG: substrate-binding domain-containing protein [Pseudonocardiaceae bacterium]
MGAEGLAPDVQNSVGDPARLAAIADGMINEGVKVLVIAAPNSQVGAAVVRKAQARRIPTIEIDGPRTDPTTPLLAQGARNVLQPRYDTGAYRLVARQSVDNNQRASAVFEQLLTANSGHVDGVLAANDSVAGAVITVLRKKGLTGKVRVTGLGATPEALTAV